MKAQQRETCVRSPSSVVYVRFTLITQSSMVTFIMAIQCNLWQTFHELWISVVTRKIDTRSRQNCTTNDISVVVKYKSLPPDSIIIKTLPNLKRVSQKIISHIPINYPIYNPMLWFNKMSLDPFWIWNENMQRSDLIISYEITNCYPLKPHYMIWIT